MIEVLVVLALVGVLVLVGLSQLTPKSPRAVRSGLNEVSLALKQARGLAMLGGRNINLVFSTNPARLQAYALQVNGNLEAQPLMDVVFGRSWQRYAGLYFSASAPPFGTELEPIQGVEAIQNLGFTGWEAPLLPGTFLQGFSPQGTPQIITNGTRALAGGGIWVGVYGTTLNEKGVPYGVVLVTDRGTVETYYKSDSQVSGSAASGAMWRRVE